ncbi:MAG: tRNA pseudouridine(55) synthase TruB [Nitrospiria bacterium]
MKESGILNVNKPAGWTSHDVVARTRKLLNTKKIGHAGTLDPDATGVLILCIGKATKLVQYLIGMDKEYEAVMRLGESTTTQDASGEVLEKKPWLSVHEEDLIRCFSQFTGEITQVPSAYSAIKIGGVSSYKLARQGKDVKIPGRTVKVHKIELLGKQGPDVFIRIQCSKGTYIRTLCHDMGFSLGTRAHLFSLKRTRSGIFNINDSISLEEISDCVESNRMDMEIYGMDEVMTEYPSISIDELSEKKVIHGSPLLLKDGEEKYLKRGNVVCLKNRNGILLALGVFEGEETKTVKIDKVLIQ